MNLRDRILQTPEVQKIISETDAQYKALTNVLFKYFSQWPYGTYALDFEYDAQRQKMYSNSYPALSLKTIENLLENHEGLCTKIYQGKTLEITLGNLPTLKEDVPSPEPKRTLR